MKNTNIIFLVGAIAFIQMIHLAGVKSAISNPKTPINAQVTQADSSDGKVKCFIVEGVGVSCVPTATIQ